MDALASIVVSGDVESDAEVTDAIGPSEMGTASSREW
jgi:hypothetical protein